jgi:hypothetical protein
LLCGAEGEGKGERDEKKNERKGGKRMKEVKYAKGKYKE